MSVVSASAPGSLMIAGEHAVLYQGNAIAMALSQRLKVTAEWRHDDILAIQSNFGTSKTCLSDPLINHPHHFLSRITQALDIDQGMSIHIESNIPTHMGLGSSGALLIASYAAITHLMMGKPPATEHILSQCRNLLRDAQGGRGSGTDLAASLHGGIVHYNPDNLCTESLGHTIPLHVVYSGAKQSTTSVTQWLALQIDQTPETINKTLTIIASLVPECAQAIQQQNWPSLGKLFKQHQKAMHAMQLSTPQIDHIIKQCQHSHGAKISGSGRGDCVISLDNGSKTFPIEAYDHKHNIQSLQSQCSPEGLRYEST
jgi:mevalonate kinase